MYEYYYHNTDYKGMTDEQFFTKMAHLAVIRQKEAQEKQIG